MPLVKRDLTAALCLSVLLCQNLFSGTVLTAEHPVDGHAAARADYHSRQLQGDARILHALSRFTFGPRPGDLDAVRDIGLEKWFDSQLRPAAIDQTDLKARLAAFPAMQWSPEDLLYRAPSNALIRQALDGRLAIPERGALRAVYEDQMFRVTIKRQEKEQKKAGEPQKQLAATATDSSTNTIANAITSDNGAAVQPANTQGPVAEPNRMTTDTVPQMPFDEAGFKRLLDSMPAQRVTQLAAMPPEEADAFFRSLRPPQRAALVKDLPPDLKEIVLDLENPQRLVNEEIVAQRLTRDIYSNAQLQEVMTDFWMNHFNVFLHKNDEMPYYLVSFERDVIRPRALGKFEDLLQATAHSPAMMLYLDNAGSIGPESLAAERSQFRQNNNKKKHEGLNENYARELMELHTLGVNGGYTQADVTQVARILTGWTVERPQRGGGFEFDPRRHEPGTKVVMGRKFKEHGEQEGRELLHLLATRPATARFVSRKLAVRFVSDDPPEALVDHMANTFLKTDGDISAVLTTLFHSPEFWDTSVYRAKVKTPIEFVVSAARAGNANIENLQPLANSVREMGMPLYGCVTPNGYGWNAETWVNTNALVNRMNFALSIAANRLPGITILWDPTQTADNDTAMLEPNPDSPDPQSEESRLEVILIASGITDGTRSAVLQQFEAQSAASVMPVATKDRPKFRAQVVSQRERQDQILAGLLLGSPEFQRR